MNDSFAELLVVKRAQPRQKSKKKRQHRIRRKYPCCGDRRHAAQRHSWWWRRKHSRLRRRGYPHHTRQAVLAIQHIAHRPHAHRAHRFAAIPAIAYGIRIGMNRTLHSTLLELIGCPARRKATASLSPALPDAALDRSRGSAAAALPASSHRCFPAAFAETTPEPCSPD